METPRMKRAGWTAWNVAAAASLLLCLASLGFWIRSYWVRDTVGFGWEGGNCHVAQSILGRLHVLTNLGGGCNGGTTYMTDRLGPKATWDGRMSGYPLDVQWHLGFVWQTYSRGHFGMGQLFSVRSRLVVVPYWFPTVLFALVPIAWGAGVRHRVGVLDVMIIVAVVALMLAAPAFLARSMIQSGME